MDKEIIKNLAENVINNVIESAANSVLKNASDDPYSDEKYRDGDAFEKGFMYDLAATAIEGGKDAALIGATGGTNIQAISAALKSANKLFALQAEVQKFTEVQKTKRKEIEADRDKIVTQIEAQKEVLLAYLEKTFDERKENLSKLFEVVDNAISNNNMQQLALGLDSINKLIASSPFKDLATIESTQLALGDKSHEWDF